MKHKFDPLLFNLIILVLVGSPKRWIQAGKIPKVSSIIPGEALISHRGILSFDGRLNPAIVHSHGVKMKWSKPRHYSYDAAGRDLPPSPPPSLAHSVTKRLLNQIFASLFSRLPYEHAKKVFEWKNADGLIDLEPDCKVVPHDRDGQPPINGSVDSNVGASKEQHQQDTLESCHVNFSSLHSFYGISFNFTLSFHNKLMGDLSPEDMLSRVTPDHRGWTQPISNTDVSIYVELCSPDFVPKTPKEGRVRMAGNGNISRESIEIDQRNVEEAMRALLKRSKVVLGLSHLQNLSSSQEDEFVIFPSSSGNMNQHNEPLNNESEKDKNVDSSDQTKPSTSTHMMADDELMHEILHLCQKYDMTEDECRNEMKALKFDDDNESKKSEPSTKNNHDDLQEMDELDIARLMDTMAEANDIHDIDRNVEIPRKDMLQMRQDMINIEKLIDETSMA